MEAGGPAAGVTAKVTLAPGMDATTRIGLPVVGPTTRVSDATPSFPASVVDAVSVPLPEEMDHATEVATGFPLASTTLTTSGGAVVPTVTVVLFPDTMAIFPGAPGCTDTVKLTLALGNSEIDTTTM
jgi:hypothetical protein